MTQFNFTPETPLHEDESGTVRVKGSRITLDIIVGAFNRGETAEEIQDGFPTLSVAQVNAVIAWYLNNRLDADDYLKTCEEEAEALRRIIESQPSYIARRARLLKRREELMKG